MNSLNSHTLKEWYVSYDPYTDLFQMYDDRVFRMPKNKLDEEQHLNLRIVYSTISREPLMVELHDAYEEFGKEIDELSKADIINLLLPMLKKDNANA